LTGKSGIYTHTRANEHLESSLKRVLISHGINIIITTINLAQVLVFSFRFRVFSRWRPLCLWFRFAVN